MLLVHRQEDSMQGEEFWILSEDVLLVLDLDPDSQPGPRFTTWVIWTFMATTVSKTVTLGTQEPSCWPVLPGFPDVCQ